MSKFCPKCNENIPEYAKVCKHCFYDYTANPPKKFPLLFSFGMLGISILAILLAQHLIATQIASRYVLDVETKSLLIAESSKDGTTIERVNFDKIDHLEHVIGGDAGRYAIEVVLNDGKRLTVRTSEDRLTSEAEDMASMCNLPFKELNHATIQ